MIEMYLKLVKAGKRTVESVPLKYREEVAKNLEKN